MGTEQGQFNEGPATLQMEGLNCSKLGNFMKQDILQLKIFKNDLALW